MARSIQQIEAEIAQVIARRDELDAAIKRDQQEIQVINNRINANRNELTKLQNQLNALRNELLQM